MPYIKTMQYYGMIMLLTQLVPQETAFSPSDQEIDCPI